jgi:hypothetical protein
MQHCLKLGKYSNLVFINFTFPTLEMEVDEHNTIVIQEHDSFLLYTQMKLHYSRFRLYFNTGKQGRTNIIT